MVDWDTDEFVAVSLAVSLLALAGCESGVVVPGQGDAADSGPAGRDVRRPSDAPPASDAPTSADAPPAADLGRDGRGGDTRLRRDTEEVGAPDVRRDASLPPGTPIGEFWNTYYYVADESNYSGADDTTLYDSNCDPLAEVPAAYSDDVCIEGSGKLETGEVVNYAENCSCGRPCPTGGTVCYAKLDKSKFPWGQGNRGNALVPLRSWAVDTAVISSGTVLYAPKWDGVQIPKVGGLGGFTHDGCFRADDVGGGIDGKHYDFFAGHEPMHQKLEQIFPTRSNFQVYRDSPRCKNSGL